MLAALWFLVYVFFSRQGCRCQNYQRANILERKGQQRASIENFSDLLNNLFWNSKSNFFSLIFVLKSCTKVLIVGF